MHRWRIFYDAGVCLASCSVAINTAVNARVKKETGSSDRDLNWRQDSRISSSCWPNNIYLTGAMRSCGRMYANAIQHSTSDSIRSLIFRYLTFTWYQGGESGVGWPRWCWRLVLPISIPSCSFTRWRRASISRSSIVVTGFFSLVFGPARSRTGHWNLIASDGRDGGKQKRVVSMCTCGDTLPRDRELITLDTLKTSAENNQRRIFDLEVDQKSCVVHNRSNFPLNSICFFHSAMRKCRTDTKRCDEITAERNCDGRRMTSGTLTDFFAASPNRPIPIDRAHMFLFVFVSSPILFILQWRRHFRNTIPYVICPRLARTFNY